MTVATWTISATVRRRNAIGVFYSQAFVVECAESAARNQVIDAWFTQYGEEWELNHLDRIRLNASSTKVESDCIVMTPEQVNDLLYPDDSPRPRTKDQSDEMVSRMAHAISSGDWRVPGVDVQPTVHCPLCFKHVVACKCREDVL